MKRIFDMLARLASLLYQQKFIIDGARDEYVLPDQLLSEVISYMNTMLSNQKLSGAFNEKQLKELFDLLQELERLSGQVPFDDETVSNEELILRNKYWIDVRSLASIYLKKNGFDLKNWEIGNCK